MRVDENCPKWKAALYFQIQRLNWAGKIDGPETMTMISLVDSATDSRMEIVEIQGGCILKTPGEIKKSHE